MCGRNARSEGGRDVESREECRQRLRRACAPRQLALLELEQLRLLLRSALNGKLFIALGLLQLQL